MRAIIWVIRLLLFFLLFGFAIKNDQLVTLNSFFGSQWQLPLVFVILLTFAAGARFGVTARSARGSCIPFVRRSSFSPGRQYRGISLSFELTRSACSCR